jgi:hypothetical protein
MLTAYGSQPPSTSKTVARHGPDPDSNDRADLLAVAQNRRVGQLVEDLGVDTEPSQHRCHHHGSGPLATIGDLEGDRATVCQRRDVDRLGAVLGYQPGHTPDQRGDVSSGPT